MVVLQAGGRADEPRDRRNLVAIILAIGLSTAVNLVTIGTVYDAVQHSEGLSENSTQILTTAFGGLVGILGAYVGFRAGQAGQHQRPIDAEDPEA